jgi:glycosyltransferase involved in cell wall biosynthesis
VADRLTIAVVVCVYTEARWDLIAEAVTSLRAQHRPPDEIVLVVDHNDGLLARLEAAFAAVPAIRVIPNAHGRGLSGGRNTGVAATTADVVAFLDDDAAASPGWLAELETAYADTRVAGAGGAIDAAWAAGRPRWWPPTFDWVVGCTYEGMPNTTTPVRNVIGANMSFRRTALARTGGFVEGVGRERGRPMGGEETELSIRVTSADPDAVILYVPAAGVRHHVPASRGRVRYFVSRCYAEGLSKATVARLVGPGRGLASERRHTVVTLPRAAGRALLDAVRRRDAAVAAQALMIAIGLGVTVAGYVVGTVAGRLGRA